MNLFYSHIFFHFVLYLLLYLLVVRNWRKSIKTQKEILNKFEKYKNRDVMSSDGFIIQGGKSPKNTPSRPKSQLNPPTLPKSQNQQEGDLR